MAEKKTITIVGAGLSGLTAAINLARDGWKVKVLDKEERQGGRPEFRPDGAASPFDLKALEAYTGIDISPACKPIETMYLNVFGNHVAVPHQEGSEIFMVERSSRSTSIDTLLHEYARDAGVEFEWGFSIRSPSDVAELPEWSIVATGLDVQGFEAMGIPYVPLWGWYAKRTVEDDRTLAWAYVDDFTVDYAFTTQVNGTIFALLFQRERTLTREDKAKFERYMEDEGLGLDNWKDLLGGAAPHQSIDNPILFKNNMIITGTLAGVMEPMLNFGMLGAMVSGKIGAIAVTDMGLAYREFKRLTSFFKRSMVLKRLQDITPHPVRRLFWTPFANMLGKAGPEARNRGMHFVPGYGGFDSPPR